MKYYQQEPTLIYYLNILPPADEKVMGRHLNNGRKPTVHANFPREWEKILNGQGSVSCEDKFGAVERRVGEEQRAQNRASQQAGVLSSFDRRTREIVLLATGYDTGRPESVASIARTTGIPQRFIRDVVRGISEKDKNPQGVNF